MAAASHIVTNETYCSYILSHGQYHPSKEKITVPNNINLIPCNDFLTSKLLLGVYSNLLGEIFLLSIYLYINLKHNHNIKNNMFLVISFIILSITYFPLLIYIILYLFIYLI